MLAVVGTAVVAEVTAVVVAANTTEESTITRAAEPIGPPTKATTLTRTITTMTNVRGSTAGL
jgi:hypothetical protein